MFEKYGFFIEEYENGTSMETLATGDGKSEFSDMLFSDGTVGLGIGYGDGGGLGAERTHAEGTLSTDVGVKWQIKFESQKSIDAMIIALLRAKSGLANTPEKKEK